MFICFNLKWYLIVLPFQRADLTSLFSDVTGIAHVQSVWIMPFGTLTGVRSVQDKHGEIL